MSTVSLLFLAIGCGDDDPPADDASVDASTDASDATIADGDADVVIPEVPLCDLTAQAGAYPDPGAFPDNSGPGGPTRTFTEDELYQNCSYLDGGDLDVTDHHNLVTMYDGYLLMPWAPEFGRGGLTFFDISDPCAPTVAGSGFSESMRETHSIGFSDVNGRYAVVDMIDLVQGFDYGGVQFWDVSNPEAPEAVSDLPLPGFGYPDAYARVVLSVFWQVPYVYAAGADNGIYVIDATDARNPSLVNTYTFDPVLRTGQVQAIGNLLIVTAAEGARTVLLDISDPENPQPIPGGDFQAVDENGTPREAYFTNTAGGYVYYARKEGGGGLMVHDISDPENPTPAGVFRSDGNGGYVFIKEGLAFVGESRFAAIYDVTDLTAISEVARMDLEGDLDTVTPIGNVAVLSVDDEAIEDQGSSIAPYALEPDTLAPEVNFVWPANGDTEVLLTSRIGATFSEFVDVRSAWVGSVRLYETGSDMNAARVPGVVSTQEAIVNFHPCAPLAPDTDYTFEVTAGGVTDFNGNAITETFTSTFRTVSL
ncbi:MAG: Ig-like domain-containing protein [Myxococcota bacterium]